MKRNKLVAKACFPRACSLFLLLLSTLLVACPPLHAQDILPANSDLHGVPGAEARTNAIILPPAADSVAPAAEVMAATDPGVEKVAARARAFWRTLVKRDFDEAYQFELPSYRALFSLDTFKQRFGQGGFVKAVQVKDVRMVDEQLAKVVVTLTMMVNPASGAEFPPTETDLTESWLLRDDQWWRVGSPSDAKPLPQDPDEAAANDSLTRSEAGVSD